ncbi:mitochondrial carrier [Acaromyces ingoldii]|uniref:Mitochondrial carrier n=1 Tax=Acaromyces ingoldii TaxID=215250 RepID=A0A316YV14_9BASI|nr:mitochondrial carrier [Acaromyces ingoldii]PWN91883.1 mitochondrial carrier [Acaromyces ingoldii]
MGNDGIESSLVGQVAGPSRLASIGTPVNPGDSNGLLSGIGQSLGVQAAVPPIWWNPTTWSEDKVNDFLWNYRTIVAAGTASLVSTAASFPFDSLKSRLQVKYYPSIWACGKAVLKEEGMKGFFRGVTIPLITISFVRTSSFSIYVNTKEALHRRGYLADSSKLWHTALSGAAGGATSGVIISCGSAPFELVKVQRQLEYLTAVQKGLVTQVGSKYQARSGFQAAAEIWRYHGGPKGFYLGFPLHMCRDTLGTALYFGFYDTIRSYVRRHASPNTKPGGQAQLFGLPGPVVSFLSGSTAGIASWLIVYPVDLLKTNVQQRSLSNHPKQLTGWQLFTHLMRERPPPDPSIRDTFLKRFLRLYRGLGVSALRSFISHGLTWTLIESISARISERTGKPFREDATSLSSKGKS